MHFSFIAQAKHGAAVRLAEGGRLDDVLSFRRSRTRIVFSASSIMNNVPKEKNSLVFCSCFVKMIGDKRDILTETLIDTLTPLIYEGILAEPCEKAFRYEARYAEASRKDKDLKNPGFDHLFQFFLLDFKKMSSSKIDDETKRIRTNSDSAEFFDDLIRAVVKSHITVLKCTVIDGDIIKDKFHETIDINLFIHKSYNEAINLIFYNPKLFYREVEFQKNGVDDLNYITYQMKCNKEMIFSHIKAGIKKALRKILPMRQILNEYLTIDLCDVNQNYMETIKNMVIAELQTQQKTQTNLLEDDNPDKFSVLGNDNGYDLNALIYGRNMEDTQVEQQKQIIFVTNPLPTAVAHQPSLSENQEKHSEEVREVKLIDIDPKIMSAINSIKGPHGKAASGKAVSEKIAEKPLEEKVIVHNEKPISEKAVSEKKNEPQEINIVRKLPDINEKNDNQLSEATDFGKKN
jgi:hypothetical protein